MKSKNTRSTLAFSLFVTMASSVSLPLYAAGTQSTPLNQSTSLKLVDPAHIVKAARDARQTVHDHRMMSRALVAVTAGQKFFELYTLMNSFSRDSSKEKEVDPKAAKEDAEKGGFFSRVGSGIGDAFNCLISPKSWGNGVVFIGKQIPTMTGLIVSDLMVRSLVAKVEHPDSMLWFKNKETSYDQVMSDLVVYAQKIKRNEGSAEDKALTVSLFVQAARDMVAQIEKIVGYMHYRKSQMHDKALLIADIERHIIRTTNELINELNKKIIELNKGNALNKADGLNNGNAQDRKVGIIGDKIGDTLSSNKLLREFKAKIDELFNSFAGLDENSHEQRNKNTIAENKKMIAGNEHNRKVGRAIMALPEAMRAKVDSLLQENAERLCREREEADRAEAKQQAKSA